MSRVVDIILITSELDQANVEALSFWMGDADALDLGTEDEMYGELQVGGGPAYVGRLVRLNGRSRHRLGKCRIDLPGCLRGAVTSHLHWDRFLERVRTTDWEMPERVQLLMKDEGDTYFRMYMLFDGELRNVVPAPADEGFDRDWCR